MIYYCRYGFQRWATAHSHSLHLKMRGPSALNPSSTRCHFHNLLLLCYVAIHLHFLETNTDHTSEDLNFVVCPVNLRSTYKTFRSASGGSAPPRHPAGRMFLRTLIGVLCIFASELYWTLGLQICSSDDENHEGRV